MEGLEKKGSKENASGRSDGLEGLTRQYRGTRYGITQNLKPNSPLVDLISRSVTADSVPVFKNGG
jgi:hypothetical protein